MRCLPYAAVPESWTWARSSFGGHPWKKARWKPYDEQTATVGNGVMVAIRAKSKEEVDALYNKAIELGGADEGAAGPRGDGFYAGYFRDLEGNKLNAFYMG